MWNANDGVDDKVTISIEDKNYECNRKKLSEYSAYFNAMFHGNFIEKNEKSITLQDVNINGFLNILKYIDNANTFIEYDYVIDTLQCACMLQFETIKKQCITRLVYELRVDNCLQIWNICELLDIHPLLEQAKCKAFIEFNTVKDCDYFQQLEPYQLHSYLANNLIYCDNEMDIFEAGMKWWYEYSSKLQTNEPLSEDEIVKYLLLVLSCIDFKSLNINDINQILTYPDIASNNKINCILNEVNSLLATLKDTPECFYYETLNDPDIIISDEAKKLFTNSKRQRTLLPCIITSELSWQPGQKSKVNKRIMNISYYDEKNMCLKKLLDPNSQFQNHCSYNLKGCKILPYKENLLLFGGEENYGTANWNKNVWIYYTNRDEWELLTKMPKERRHFVSYIVDDKLFIVGGTGKFRIKLCDDMCYYNFQTNEWTTNLHLPRDLYEKNVCVYKKYLLFVRMLCEHDMSAVLFNPEKNSWIKLSIQFPSMDISKNFPESYIIFAKDDSIYLKGVDMNKLLEFTINGYNLTEKEISNVKSIPGDKMNFYLSNNNLYLFTKIGYMEDIYVLECLDLNTKINKKLIQINDSSDEQWHINRGCFGYFHYSLTENNSCISKFLL